MLKRLPHLLILFFLMASECAIGLSCPSPDPVRIVESSDTIFVAFVLEGRYVEGEGSNDCGWIDGSFEVVEELKGHAQTVSVIKKRLNNCNGRRIAGSSDRFPLGKFVLVATNDESGRIGLCSHEWETSDSCLIDGIRRELGIAAQNEELREWCIENEKSRGKLSYIESLRQHISRLESEQRFITDELEELKKELSEVESSEIDR